MIDYGSNQPSLVAGSRLNARPMADDLFFAAVL
jgi:hypothetical protein